MMVRRHVVSDSEDELPELADLLRPKQTKFKPRDLQTKSKGTGSLEPDACIRKTQSTSPSKQRALRKVDNNARFLGPFAGMLELATATEERRREVRKSPRKPRTIMRPIDIFEDDETTIPQRPVAADETWHAQRNEESDDEISLISRNQLSPKEKLLRTCSPEHPSRQIAQDSRSSLDLSNPFLGSRKPILAMQTTSTSRPTSSSSHADPTAILHYTPQKRLSPIRKISSTRPSTPPPTLSPSKKLSSPSKARIASIPAAPIRESLDAFWSQDLINDWNEQYSPKKLLASPRRKRFGNQASDDESGETPSPSTSPRKRSPQKHRSPTKASREAKKVWEEQKKDIAERFLEELDQRITGGKIAELSANTGGVQVLWSKKLNSTAGRANWRREGVIVTHPNGVVEKTYKHFANIELAEKVVDDELKLVNVVAHEFCHLANFMVSGVRNNPHGKEFKEWAKKCSQTFGERGIEVTTKHSYDIDYKYIWECAECGHEFKRHSKSICPEKQACGTCKGKLVQIKPAVRTNAKTSDYQLFVKEHYQRVKKDNGGAAHGVVMEILGRSYREQKENNATIAVEGKTTMSVVVEELDTGSVDSLTKKLEIVVLDD